MNLKIFYILLLAAISLSSCKNDIEESSCTQAFIGGEIINPNSDFIILTKSRKIVDSIFLDNRNRFAYKLTDLEPGLYNFFDGREIQTILLQANDSLLFRLNTIEFDESLVFTGKGAKENNYLINLFLENEKEERKILALSQLSPLLFEERIDALRKQKLEKLNKFKSKNKSSKLFNEVAEANINYNYYYSKEFYPFANYSKSELEIFNSLPPSFYDYRKNIDYNNELLKEYPPYNSFLRFHFNNLALQDHFLHSKDRYYNEHSVDYNLDKLKLVDEKIDNEEIKNNLLNYAIVYFIGISKSTDNYDELLKSFTEKSTNERDIRRATRIVNSYKRLKPGQKLPPITLLDENDNKIALTRLITKPTVLYFWTKKSKNHLIDSHKRVKELEVKYPEVNFLAINTDSISYTQQTKILKHFQVRINNEYRFMSPKACKEKLSIQPINNVFIVNKYKRIVNAKANMFNISFEQELLGVINQ